MELDYLRKSLSGLRIMVVEDSTFLGIIIGEMLEEAHCLVLGPFRTVADAARALDLEAPDAVILDISIGGDLSFTLAGQIRNRDIPLLLMSGYFSHAVPADFRDRFLQKPFDEATLLDALARIMGSSQTRSRTVMQQSMNHADGSAGGAM